MASDSSYYSLRHLAGRKVGWRERYVCNHIDLKRLILARDIHMAHYMLEPTSPTYMKDINEATKAITPQMMTVALVSFEPVP